MDCKFKELETLEALSKKSSAELYGCGCERCLPVAKEVELEELRAEKQARLAEEAARQEAKKEIEALKKGVESFENELKSIKDQVRDEEIKREGLDKKGFLNNPLFQAYMNNQYVKSTGVKNVYSNTRYGREQLSPEVKNFVTWAQTGQVEYKDLAGDTGSGSYVVPNEMYNQIVTERDRVSILRQAGVTSLIMSSDQISVPVETARGNNGAWRANQGAAYTPNDSTLNEIVLQPKLWGDLVKVSQEMMADSAINVAEYLARLFGRRLGYAENQAFFVGDGTAQPITGIARQTTNMIQVTATATAMLEKVTNLHYALSPENRRSAAFFVPSATIGKIANAFGVNWFESLRAGQPPTILGRPVFEVPDLDTIDANGAAGVQPGRVLFGNPEYIFIGDRQGLTVSRSTERYFETGHIAFRADARVDMKLASGTSLKPFAYSDDFAS
jgi:HK97 family phage major capsid protein